MKHVTYNIKMFVDKYRASGGTEYFLSFEDMKRQVVFAFCRLRICHPEFISGSRGMPKQVRHDKTDPSVASTRLSQDDKITYPAFIRELHTYGQLVSLKHANTSLPSFLGGNNPHLLKGAGGMSEEVQHTGLGKKLVAEAEKICRKIHPVKFPAFGGDTPKGKFNRVKKLAVISGVGVRDYYRRLGYRLAQGYMVKNLK